MRKQTAKATLRKRVGVALLILLPIGILIGLIAYIRRYPLAVLSPQGPIGVKQLHLIEFALLLSALVMVPVYIMTILIAFKYREANHKQATYTPEWDGSRMLESIWWGIPIAIILVLSVVTWRSTYALDPYKPLASTHTPLTIQVVSLDWKWLFIYPQQHVASVNEVAVPVGTPVTFKITSETVMNSFWIPALGGQIYAMPGMNTDLNLQADRAGTYAGSSANISGAGFADMNFTAKALDAKQFATWVSHAQHSPQALTAASYKSLAAPSKKNAVTYYRANSPGLYNDVIMQYMMPGMTIGGNE